MSGNLLAAWERIQGGDEMRYRGDEAVGALILVVAFGAFILGLILHFAGVGQ